jgi:hypothetical protein
MDCTFTVDVWLKLKSALNFHGRWAGKNFHDCFKGWSVTNPKLQFLPALTCWFLWKEWNLTIFEDKFPLLCKVVHLTLKALKEHSKEKTTLDRRTELTHKNFGNIVGWFDGAATSSRTNSGARGVIKYNKKCNYKWYINCGPGSNTRA